MSDQERGGGERGVPLEFAGTEALIDELVRRFPQGAMYLERPAGQSDREVGRYMRTWGNAVWGIGAAAALLDRAKADHEACWAASEDMGEDD
jgi:hypothetical protein